MQNETPTGAIQASAPTLGRRSQLHRELRPASQLNSSQTQDYRHLGEGTGSSSGGGGFPAIGEHDRSRSPGRVLQPPSSNPAAPHTAPDRVSEMVQEAFKHLDAEISKAFNKESSVLI